MAPWKWLPVGVTAVEGPAVASPPEEGRLDLFWVDVDGTVRTQWTVDGENWKDPTDEGFCLLPPAATTNAGEGPATVVSVGGNTHAYTRRLTRFWAEVPLPTCRGVAATVAVKGLLELFLSGGDGQLWTTQRLTIGNPQGTWTASTSLGTPLPNPGGTCLSPPCAVSWTDYESDPVTDVSVINGDAS